MVVKKYFIEKPLSGYLYDRREKKYFTWGFDIYLNGSRIQERGLSDSVSFPLDRDLFERITKAKPVEFRAGTLEGRRTEKEITQLQNLLAAGNLQSILPRQDFILTC